MSMRLDYPRYPQDVREKQVVSLPSSKRRLIEFHLTAFPSVINEDKMKTMMDTSCQENDGEGCTSKNLPTVEMEKRAVALMTTNQLTARMTELAKEDAIKVKESEGYVPLMCSDKKTRMYGSRFDRSSTYRLDYCNKEVPGFHRRVRDIPDYQKNWNDVDMANIQEANKFPFLTMPESILKKRQTVYRHDYIPEAIREDYRTLPHKTNLQDVTSSFAYSAYSLSDPARVVRYDSTIASCRNPRCLLWKTHSPRDSIVGKSNNWKSVSAELQKLRGLRRAQGTYSSKSSSSRSKNSETPSEKPRKVVLPGMRGMGYRQAGKDDSDYVYLPRDTFMYQTVYDY